MGDVWTAAKKIKADHSLALKLWGTKNIDARLLSTLIINPEKISHDEINRIVKSEKFAQAANWLYAYVIKLYPDNESLRIVWINSEM